MKSTIPLIAPISHSTDSHASKKPCYERTSCTTLICKGAKVTRSTSAYALPLFLPRPENSKQKAPVHCKNNPEIPLPAPF